MPMSSDNNKDSFNNATKHVSKLRKPKTLIIIGSIITIIGIIGMVVNGLAINNMVSSDDVDRQLSFVGNGTEVPPSIVQYAFVVLIVAGLGLIAYGAVLKNSLPKTNIR